jgi:hypothetical protein
MGFILKQQIKKNKRKKKRRRRKNGEVKLTKLLSMLKVAQRVFFCIGS